MTCNHRLPVETGQWDDKPLIEQNIIFALQTTLVLSIIISFHVDFLRVTENCI